MIKEILDKEGPVPLSYRLIKPVSRTHQEHEVWLTKKSFPKHRVKRENFYKMASSLYEFNNEKQQKEESL